MTTTDFLSLLDGGSPEDARAPAPVCGRELEELLRPLSCEEFIDTCFARRSLSVAGKGKETREQLGGDAFTDPGETRQIGKRLYAEKGPGPLSD